MLVNHCLTWVTGDSIDYRIRISARTRNVHLKLSMREGLTVLVPPGFDSRRIPAIVERKRCWVKTHLRRFADHSAASARAEAAAPPEHIELPALDESWRIAYQPTKTRKVGVIGDKPGWLTVYGAVADHDACRAALRQWLKCRTREELVPRLSRLAEQNGFRFNEVLVRGQKTRWASCSSQGTISLSYKLLFLDRDSVRCVLLHELCHTVHLNHSRNFWTLVSRLEPGYKAIDKRLRDGWKRVPAWVDRVSTKPMGP
jgi:predicted metal-dependent hydrolase